MVRFEWEKIPTPHKNKFVRYVQYLSRPVFVGSFLRTCWFRYWIKHKDLRNTALRCADMGCGEGLYSFYLTKQFPLWHIEGYDIDRASLDNNCALAKQWGCTHLSFYEEDIHTFHKPAQFDLMISVCMLIYWSRKEQKQILYNMCESIKDMGRLILILPRKNYSNTNLLPTTWFPESSRKIQQENRGFLYAPEDIINDLKEVGFTTVHVKLCGGLWGRLATDLEYTLIDRKHTRWLRLSMPLLKFLCVLDTYWCLGKKRWLLVWAEK